MVEGFFCINILVHILVCWFMWDKGYLSFYIWYSDDSFQVFYVTLLILGVLSCPPSPRCYSQWVQSGDKPWPALIPPAWTLATQPAKGLFQEPGPGEGLLSSLGPREEPRARGAVLRSACYSQLWILQVKQANKHTNDIGSFKASNYCYWHLDPNSFWPHVNTAWLAQNLPHSRREGEREQGQNNSHRVQKLYGPLHWPPRETVPSTVTPRAPTFLLEQEEPLGNALELCDDCRCEAQNLPTNPTIAAPRKNLHKAVICKISDSCFVLIWGFCLGNGSSAGTAPAQQLHCFSTSTNTRKVRQSPVCAGRQPALYYYVLLVHSEKCALQEKKKPWEAQ